MTIPWFALRRYWLRDAAFLLCDLEPTSEDEPPVYGVSLLIAEMDEEYRAAFDYQPNMSIPQSLSVLGDTFLGLFKGGTLVKPPDKTTHYQVPRWWVLRFASKRNITSQLFAFPHSSEGGADTEEAEANQTSEVDDENGAKANWKRTSWRIKRALLAFAKLSDKEKEGLKLHEFLVDSITEDIVKEPHPDVKKEKPPDPRTISRHLDMPRNVVTKSNKPSDSKD